MNDNNRMTFVHDSYPEFCKEYRKTIFSDDGIVINQIRYGEGCSQPVTKGSWVIYPEIISEDKDASGIEYRCEKICRDILEHGAVKISILADQMYKNSIRDKAVQQKDRKLLPECLAPAEFIYSEEILPSYFIKRKEQYVILYVPAGAKWLQYNRAERANGILSRLLNSDCIILGKGLSRIDFMRVFQLDGFFHGQVMEEDEFIKTHHGSAARVAFSEKTESIQDTDKKKILLFAAWNDDDKARVCVTNMCACLDYSKYDVTYIVNKPVKEKWLQNKLESDLHPAVRVVNRTDRCFSVTSDKATNVQFIIDNLRNTEQIEYALEMIDQSVLHQDICRLISEHVFDCFCYIGKYNGLWIALTKGIQAFRKIRFVLDYEWNKNTIRNGNMMVLYDRLFDAVYCETEKMLSATEETLDTAVNMQIRSIPPRYTGKERSLYMTLEEEKCYAAAFESAGGGNYYTVLLPLPKDTGDAFLLDLEVSDLSLVKQWMKKNLKSEDTVVGMNYRKSVVGDLSFEKEENMITVVDFPVEDLSSLTEYVRRFRGYITTDPEDASAWKICADAAGIPCFYAGEDQKEIPRDESVNDMAAYADTCRTAAERFLGFIETNAETD